MGTDSYSHIYIELSDLFGSDRDRGYIIGGHNISSSIIIVFNLVASIRAEQVLETPLAMSDRKICTVNIFQDNLRGEYCWGIVSIWH